MWTKAGLYALRHLWPDTVQAQSGLNIIINNLFDTKPARKYAQGFFDAKWSPERCVHPVRVALAADTCILAVRLQSAHSTNN